MAMNKMTDGEKIQFNTHSSISVTSDADNPEHFPPHWHNAAEFTLIRKDGCFYRVGDTTYTLHRGDILLVWPHQVHETIKIPEEGAVFIQFPAVLIESHLDLVSISRFLYDCNSICHDKNGELADFVADKILEIQKIHNSSDPLSETKCKLCIYEVLCKIGEYVLAKTRGTYNPAGPSGGTSWSYIHAACTYIVENAAENLTQAQVASHVGLSTFYFSKLFKQYMHMSFPAYLSNLRVKSAASLLLDETLSITECAFRAGFQSTTAFNKAFHDITGYSPREYRKLYR